MAVKKNKRRRPWGRIGVLMGGASTERDVSLKSGKAVYGSLKKHGVDVVAIEITTEDLKKNIKLIKSHNIDCAFLALHGRFGEDGGIQGILDTMGIAYTGSGKLASQLAMDKIASRNIFQIYGLPVPRYKVAEKTSYNKNLSLERKLSFPLVVKPATHGSSIGLSIVEKKKDLASAIELAFSFDKKIIIEEYIKGREMTVGILDEAPLPVIEIVPKRKFFDYEAKYRDGMTEYIVPATIEKEIAEYIQRVAISAHRFLGCFGCSRIDIILRQDNIPFILEVNSIPGFTPTSLLPKAAKVIGLDFTKLCLKLIELAYEKQEVKGSI